MAKDGKKSGKGNSRVTAPKDRSGEKLQAGVRSLREAMDQKEKVRASLRVTMNVDLVEDLADASKAHEGAVILLARTEAAGSEPTDEMRAAVEETREAKEHAELAKAEQSVEFVAEALGRQELEDLEREHKPTREQAEELKKTLKQQGLSPNHERLRYNADSFPPALITASLIAPERPSLEDVQELWDHPNWSKGELTELLDLCYRVNNIVL